MFCFGNGEFWPLGQPLLEKVDRCTSLKPSQPRKVALLGFQLEQGVRLHPCGRLSTSGRGQKTDTLPGTNMEVENAPLEDHFPL